MTISSLRGAVALAAMLLLAACASGGAEPAVTGAPGAPTSAAPAAPVPPEQRAAMRVASVRIDSPGEVEMMVGDSFAVADVRATPLDEDGAPVDGAPPLRHFVATVGGDANSLTISSNDMATVRGGIVRAMEPGRTSLVVFQPVPGLSEEDFPPFGRVELTIVPRPVARLDLRAPDAPLFVGGSIDLMPAAYTDLETERDDVEFRWTSSDRSVATVGHLGVVRGMRPGRATITVTGEGVSRSVELQVRANPVARVELLPDDASLETGDVLRLRAVARDANGREVPDAPIQFAVSGGGPRAGVGAAVYPDGAFVAEQPGTYRVTASSAGRSAEAVIRAEPRSGGMIATRVGTGMISNTPTSDIWVFRGNDGRDYAYTGTHVGGQKMFVWDVTDAAAPVLTDSVVVDARVVNDVKVNADATVAVITREGASDRRNGIVLLDLADPAHPTVASTYTETLTGGVHNTFIVGDLVYAIHNGTLDVHIIDISDPRAAREVGRWGIDSEGKYLHDIWVVDGIGYVSYWNDGMYIIDLGGAGMGGTPTEPVVVSSVAYPEGNTHVAFPYTNSAGNRYVFVGDEIFGCEDCVNRVGTHEDGPRGYVHVFDVSDLTNPVEVAKYEVPEAGVHNLWIEDDRMYTAYYQAGVRVVDVSGELRGDLYRQGRELAWMPTGMPPGEEGQRGPYIPNSSFAWGPQPYRGNVFVSDFNSGLWVVRFTPKEPGEMIP